MGLLGVVRRDYSTSCVSAARSGSIGKDDWPRVKARHRLDDLVRQQLAQVRVKSLLQRVWLPPD